jgi:hypothetical protein
MWIWHYDRQGCVQSEGINFVQDLPSFLVLLFAFQRLRLDQWGLNPRLDDRVRIAHRTRPNRTREKYSGKIKDLQRWTVTIDSRKFTLLNDRVLYSTFSLTGRGTLMVLAEPTKSELAEAEIAPEFFVVKIYWPEEVRKSEQEIIHRARQAANGDTDITDHLPIVTAQEDYEYKTGAVRRALGLRDNKAGYPRSRVLRVVVFPYLVPITSLAGKDFIRAWLQCVRCECY